MQAEKRKPGKARRKRREAPAAYDFPAVVAELEPLGVSRSAFYRAIDGGRIRADVEAPRGKKQTSRRFSSDFLVSAKQAAAAGSFAAFQWPEPKGD